MPVNRYTGGEDPGSFHVDPGTGLIARGGETIVLTSPHHDLVAPIRHGSKFMHNAVEILGRQRAETPLVASPNHELALAVTLLDGAWQWAEFVRVDDVGDRRQVFCTAYAVPAPDPGAPSYLDLPRPGSGQPGDAIVCELSNDPQLVGWVCVNAYLRRNRTGEIDRSRRAAVNGQNAYLLERP